MGIDIATLGIKVDAGEVDKAGQSLDKLAEKGGKAEAATDKLKTSATAATAEVNKAAAATQAEIAQTERLASVAQRAIDRQAAAQGAASRATSTLGGESGSRATVAAAAAQMVGGRSPSVAAAEVAAAARATEQAVVEMESKTAGIFARFKQNALGAFDAVRDFITNNGTRFRGLFGANGASTMVKEAEAVEQVGHKAAISSLAVKEIITLGREAGRGDFSRMAGSATILAQSLGVLKNVGIGTIGIIGALVLSVGVLAAAYISGAEASSRFDNQIRLSGNYAGLTASSYTEMAHAIAASTNTSVASNQTLITTLAATNNFTAAQINALVAASERLSVATGQSADDIVADFAHMADGPTAYAEAYQRTHIGVISPLILNHIRELEEQGDKEQALAILIQSVTGDIAANAVENTGIIIRAWRGATNALSDFWTQLTRIGATESTAERIRDIDAQLAFANSSGPTTAHAYIDVAALQAQRAQLQAQMQAEGAAAVATANHARQVREGTDAAAHYGETYRGLTDNTYRYNNAVRDLDTTLARMRRNNDPAYADAAAHRPQTLEALRRQYEPQAVRADHRAASAAEAAARREARQAETRAVSISNVNAELDKQINLMGLLGPARERQQRYDQIDQSMLQRRIHLTPEETQQIQAKIAQIQQLSVVQTQLDRIYGESTTPLQTYNATVEAGAQLLERHLITVPQLMNQLSRAKVALDHANDPLLDFNRAFHDEADDIRFENSLLGMNAQQRAIANAQRAIEIRLRDQDRTGNTSSAAAIQAETDAIIANATARGQRQLVADTAREYTDHIKRMNDAIRAATANFGELFGTAGTGFANLITVITNYRDTQLDAEARIAEARAQYGADSVEANRVERQTSEEMANARINQYGDMISAAKTFFKEGSTGYRILEGAERAYRLFQFAMAVKAMLIDSAHTASSVANSGIRATADGVAAFAKTLASLPFPFNLIAGAAVLAALIAVGVKIAGGGKSAKVPSASATAAAAVYSGPVDEYGAPTSSYSVLKPGQVTVKSGANDNGVGGGSYGGMAGGNVISFGDTHIEVHGDADQSTVDQLRDVLDQHKKATVEEARAAVAADAAARAGRQRIGAGG